MSNDKILKKISNWMTVGQLREELEAHPDDAIVVFSISYGDRGNTEQALPIENVEDMVQDRYSDLSETAYSHSGIELRDLDDDDDDADDEGISDAKTVVVLS